MTRVRLMVLCFLGALLASCGDAENEYSSISCYFVFDNATHQDATLASAMNSLSPGVFCYITKTTKGGATYLNFSNNQGASSTALANAVDLKRSIILGMNNGLIVGYGNMDNPAIFYAFDSQCPNCFDPEALPVKSYLLTMTSNGLAKCATCGREYNMNAGGVVVSGSGGSKMTRYRASTTGVMGVLSVN